MVQLRDRMRPSLLMRFILGLTAVVSLACAPAAAPAPASPAVSAPAPAPAKPEKLVIAVQPSSTPEQLSADAKDLREYLSGRLNRDVEIMFPTTSAGVIEALRFGHAQAAFMSAWPLALAQKHAGASVALAEIREVVIDKDKREEPYYFSYWVVNKNSPVTKMEDLRGKKVALPSQLSTSGYVAPIGRLVELGLIPTEGKEADPKKFFGDVLYAGGYAQGWEALKNGQVDATVIAGDVAEKLYREVLDNTRIIEKQGPVPSHGVAYAKTLDDATRAQLTAALKDLGQPERRPLMRKFISGIFVGFKETTAEEHLGSLNRLLGQTQFQFVERLR